MRKTCMTCLLAACVAANAQSPSNLQGFWYTDGVENGVHARFVMKNRANGIFVKTIADITDCRHPRSWIETGHWSFRNSRLEQITESVDGEPVDAADPEYNDGFDISGNDRHFAMSDSKTKVTWQVDKVAADFQIPTDCGTV